MGKLAITLPLKTCGIEVLVLEDHVWLEFTTKEGKLYILRVNDLKRIVDNPICLNPTLSKVLKVWLAERLTQAEREKELRNA